MIVMKFGGSSIGSVDRIRTAASVVSDSLSAQPVVILSAMEGVTDQLIETGDRAVVGRDADVAAGLSALRVRHAAAISALLTAPDRRAAANRELEPIWEEIHNVFTGVLLLRERSPRSGDLISSFGERLIVPVFSAYLGQEGILSEAFDARGLIVTTEEADFAQVDFVQTKKQCQTLTTAIQGGAVPVVTGYICSTADGITTTLGRGGSDYTASILGFALDVEEIQIWTDVDGVMTADPRIVPHARALSRISYKEAAEMSYFGAKVLHPKTITPAADAGIPIRIKNTAERSAEGTRVTRDSPESHQGVKTVASIMGVSLVSIEGRGMLGIPGTARRVFGAIAQEKINVLMFSQGSSEQHISMVVTRAEGAATVRALEREFRREFGKRQVDRITEISDIAIIALVGEGMKSVRGVAARALGVLGKADMNILMIAQGSSELNLSFVVEAKDAPEAIRLIHDGFELGQ